MSDPTRRAAPPGWAVASSALAPVALIGGWLLAGALQPAGRYAPVRQTISVLAGYGATDRWVMTAALLTVGACHVVTACGLRGAARPARVLLAVAGLGGLGLAVFAQPRHGDSAAHIVCTTVAFVALGAFPAVLAARAPGPGRGPLLLRPAGRLAGGVLSAVLLGWLVLAMGGPHLGLAERVQTGQQALWPLLGVLALRRTARSRRSAAPIGGGPLPDAEPDATMTA